MSNKLGTPPGHMYSDVTRNVGNTPALQSHGNNGFVQNPLAGNLNGPPVYNYGGMSNNNGTGVPSLNLEKGNQQFPYQAAFRAEEGMRGAYGQ